MEFFILGINNYVILQGTELKIKMLRLDPFGNRSIVNDKSFHGVHHTTWSSCYRIKDRELMTIKTTAEQDTPTQKTIFLKHRWNLDAAIRAMLDIYLINNLQLIQLCIGYYNPYN